jgi:recombination endonuclease VII
MKSTSERDEVLAAQGGACAICGITGLTWGKGFARVWATDHKHGQEGTHRGVLCGNCNTALGKLEPHMDKVITYLAKYAAEQGASTEGSDT